MPKIFFPEKVVLINGDTKKIMEFYDNSVEKFKKEETLSSLTHTDSAPKDSSWATGFLQRLEGITGKSHGANKFDLPECSHDLSAESFLLYSQYKNFLISHLIDHKGNETYDLFTKKEIENRSILITQLILRLTAEALNDQQKEKYDNIMLNIMDRFFQSLIDSNVFADRSIFGKKYFTGYADYLFHTYNKWQMIFHGRINTIQKLYLNKNKISNALDDLIKLRFALLAAIVYECARFMNKDLPSKESFRDYFIEYTFRYFISMLEGVDKESVDHLQIEMTEFSLPIENETINNLFSLLVQTNKLVKAADKLNNIIIGAGWFPFMAGIINMSDFSKRYSEHFSICSKTINKLLETPLPEGFIYLDVAALRDKNMKSFSMMLEQFDVVDGLNELNNPYLLQQLSSKFKSDIDDLLSLQDDIACNIIDKNKIQQLIGSVTVQNKQDNEVTTLGAMHATFKHAEALFEKDSLRADELFGSIITSSDKVVKIRELALFHKGVLLYRDKQYQAALDCFNAIKTIEDEKIYYNKGMCHVALGNIKDAEDYFKKINNSDQLISNARRVIENQQSTVSVSNVSVVQQPAFISKPKAGVSENVVAIAAQRKVSSGALFSSQRDLFLSKYQKFSSTYSNTIDWRVEERGLEVIARPDDKDIEPMIRKDVKAKSKKVYIFPIKENGHLEWHYFYPIHDGKRIRKGQLNSDLLPDGLEDFYHDTKKKLPSLLKAYLLTVILDKKFAVNFAHEIGKTQLVLEDDSTMLNESIEVSTLSHSLTH